MGILNGIKTRKMDREMEVFESVGNYKVYEPDEETFKQVIDLFSEAEQDKMEDGQYVSSFGREATIQLFRLLTNIDMTEKMYDTYATKRNVRLMLVQQYIIQVVQNYLKLGMAVVENEKFAEEMEVETKSQNRNDKTVILDKWKEKENERKAQEIVNEGIENGHIVEVGEKSIDDEIASLERKLKEKKREELLKKLAELGE